MVVAKRFDSTGSVLCVGEALREDILFFCGST